MPTGISNASSTFDLCWSGSGHAAAPACDLSGIILEGEFERIDFLSTNPSSRASGARREEHRLQPGVNFDKSQRQDLDCWKAIKMSCDLAEWGRYLPIGNEEATLAKRLAKTLCSGAEASTRTEVKWGCLVSSDERQSKVRKSFPGSSDGKEHSYLL